MIKKLKLLLIAIFVGDIRTREEIEDSQYFEDEDGGHWSTKSDWKGGEITEPMEDLILVKSKFVGVDFHDSKNVKVKKYKSGSAVILGGKND